VINENILRLEVSVDDIVLMQVLNCENDLGAVELCYFFIKITYPGQMEKELPSWAELKHEIQLGRCLEGIS